MPSTFSHTKLLPKRLGASISCTTASKSDRRTRAALAQETGSFPRRPPVEPTERPPGTDIEGLSGKISFNEEGHLTTSPYTSSEMTIQSLYGQGHCIRYHSFEIIYLHSPQNPVSSSDLVGYAWSDTGRSKTRGTPF
ncbi:hypothetical protein EVAR_100807_1 [Eumeta japonica]|uniref:Uncharacterized protein n=1 Tax=Eumeta variegata TaxID=151549 RepID=A0A4C1SJW8_EUMVA|nr:hypothetical protein EVAR_100807_1 [Eumeta japonica]